ncbi:hypothetical protein Tco_1441313 [Tanacetum coccineum]
MITTPESYLTTLQQLVEEGGSHRGNLPLLLVAHLGRNENGQSLQSTLTSMYGGNQPSTNLGGNLTPNVCPITSIRATLFKPKEVTPPLEGPPLVTLIGDTPNRLLRAIMDLVIMGPYSTGCVTPFVYWIEDYPFPDGLEMPSHVGSYDGKGDPENYLHLFEGAICMRNRQYLKEKFWSHFSQQKKFMKTHFAVHNIEQRDVESTRAFVTRYKDDTLQILDLPTTYKGLMEKTYTRIEAKEIATNIALSDHIEDFDKFTKGFSWDNNKGRKKNMDMFSPYKGSNPELLVNLSKSPREILATDMAAKAFEQHPCMVENRRSCDMSKYCHFHKDHGHETNQYREPRHQIKEAVKSRKLAHLVKGIKKGKTKTSDTQLGEWKKGDKDIVPAESLILIVNRESHSSKRKSTKELIDGIWEITFSLF